MRAVNFRNHIFQGDWIEVARSLPDGCVQVIITSPPYWGQRDYGTAKWEGGNPNCNHQPPDDAGQSQKQTSGQRTHAGRFCGSTCYKCGAKRIDNQLGLEKTFEEHIEKLVAGFRELWRILRPDGVLFLNYGDKYGGSGMGLSYSGFTRGDNAIDNRPLDMRPAAGHNRGKMDGQLLGLAWRLALALQADGWILRSDIIWAKAVSFNDKYSGSTMPESVNGTRWERCRVKVKGHVQKSGQANALEAPHLGNEAFRADKQAQWQDCPGCPKCEPNGGYVLRQGSWRCTRAHEYLFQFVKQIPYYADMEAVREDIATPEEFRGKIGWGPSDPNHRTPNGIHGPSLRGEGRCGENPSGRNLRDVWTINPQPYPDAHYATFPEDLIEPCIKVATSQKGCCPECGAAWARIIESKQIKRQRPEETAITKPCADRRPSGNAVAGVETTTLGWRPTCSCNGNPQQVAWDVQMGLEEYEPVPCVVYDPFLGSGTVAAVAARLGRDYCGSELNPDYLEKQARPRIQAAESGLTKQEIETGQGALF